MSTVIRRNSLYLSKDKVTWREGENYGIENGGHLVSINDSDEEVFLRAIFGRAWIGITDEELEGVWKWTDGSPVTYTNWDVGQPDNSRGIQHYGQVWTSGGKWDDAEEDTAEQAIAFNKRAIIEISLTLSITCSGAVKEDAGIFTTSINLSASTTTNLANGVTTYWKVTGIAADDLDSGSLTGSGTITNGKLDLQHSLKVDPDTAEQFAVSVYSDAAMTLQIGNTSSVAVEEQTVTSGGGGSGGGSGVGGGGSGGGSSDTGGSGGSTPPTAPIGGGGGGSGGIGNLPAAELKPSSIDQIDDITRRAVLQATTLKSVENVMIMETAVTPNSAEADRITGFNRRTDVVALSQEVVDQQRIIFASAKNQKAFNKQLKGSSNLIYNQRIGELVYDANGRGAGLGDTGGVLAVFEERPGLGKNNFVLLAPDVLG